MLFAIGMCSNYAQTQPNGPFGQVNEALNLWALSKYVRGEDLASRNMWWTQDSCEVKKTSTSSIQ